MSIAGSFASHRHEQQIAEEGEAEKDENMIEIMEAFEILNEDGSVIG